MSPVFLIFGLQIVGLNAACTAAVLLSNVVLEYLMYKVQSQVTEYKSSKVPYQICKGSAFNIL